MNSSIVRVEWPMVSTIEGFGFDVLSISTSPNGVVIPSGIRANDTFDQSNR
jgi:hypothetical protein